MKWIDDLNGISVALIMGVVNAGLSMMLSFGVTITHTQASAIQAFVNGLLVLVAAVAHKAATNAKPKSPPPAPPPAA